MGVVLGRSGGVGLVGLVGCPWWGLVLDTFYMAVFCVRGAPPPLGVGAFSWFLFILALALLTFCLIKVKKLKNKNCRLGVRATSHTSQEP